MLPLLTRIDHVGIACRDLDAAIGRYEATFGLQVVSLEVNEEQGVREAMLAVGGAQWRWAVLNWPLSRRGTCSPVTFSCWSRSGRTPRWAGSWPGAARACTTWGTVCRTSARRWPPSALRGVRLLDERPRHGSMGASIAFLHPADLGGVLTELVQAAGPA